MASHYPQTIQIPALDQLEAGRKAAAITAIAKNLNADSLAIIAKASAKPGADNKLKTYQNFL